MLYYGLLLLVLLCIYEVLLYNDRVSFDGAEKLWAKGTLKVPTQ